MPVSAVIEKAVPALTKGLTEVLTPVVSAFALTDVIALKAAGRMAKRSFEQIAPLLWLKRTQTFW